MKLIKLKIPLELRPSWLNEDEIILPALEDKDKHYSITINPEGVKVNFDFNKVYENILYEKYTNQKRPPYTYLPFHFHKIPSFVRYFFKRNPKKSAFPLWPIDKSLEFLREIGTKYTLLNNIEEYTKYKFSDNKKYGLILTHDIEAENNWEWVKRIAQLEMDLGFRSSWNVVPHYYKIDYDVLDWLITNGFEIGLHGYNHDNKLAYQSIDIIRKRLEDSKSFIERYEIKGFRSPSWLRTDTLFKAIEEYFIYDMSVMDVDQICPAGTGGSCSLFPYYITKKLLEIPTTLPYEAPRYFGISKGELNNFWSTKIEWIKTIHGMIVVNTHPDPHYSGNPGMLEEYSLFLNKFKNDEECSCVLPRELADTYNSVSNNHSNLPSFPCKLRNEVGAGKLANKE